MGEPGREGIGEDSAEMWARSADGFDRLPRGARCAGVR